MMEIKLFISASAQLNFLSFFIAFHLLVSKETAQRGGERRLALGRELGRGERRRLEPGGGVEILEEIRIDSRDEEIRVR